MAEPADVTDNACQCLGKRHNLHAQTQPKITYRHTHAPSTTIHTQPYAPLYDTGRNIVQSRVDRNVHIKIEET